MIMNNAQKRALASILIGGVADFVEILSERWEREGTPELFAEVPSEEIGQQIARWLDNTPLPGHPWDTRLQLP
jgi:hypothetical protein